LLKLIRPVHA